MVAALSEKVCGPQSVVVVDVMLPKASKTALWVLGVPLARMLPVTRRLTLSYTNVWLPIALTSPAPSYANGVRVKLLLEAPAVAIPPMRWMSLASRP